MCKYQVHNPSFTSKRSCFVFETCISQECLKKSSLSSPGIFADGRAKRTLLTPDVMMVVSYILVMFAGTAQCSKWLRHELDFSLSFLVSTWATMLIWRLTSREVLPFLKHSTIGRSLCSLITSYAISTRQCSTGIFCQSN